MRTLLRRLLIASWGIPLAWVIIWPIAWLFDGAEIATAETLEFARYLWTGKLEPSK